MTAATGPDPTGPDPTGPDPDAAWRAVLARDHTADGAFVTAVLTTGIYCRPSCPARHPARANVRFYADGAIARAAGFRACKRCAPDDASREEAALANALGLIAAAESAGVPPPTLALLAEGVGYSPAHFQRLFTRATGLSPAAYLRARRLESARAALSDGASVTEAVYAAGYSSPSRFYAASLEKLGMSPSVWANGGQGVTIRWAVVPTTLGAMLVAATDKGICRLSFDETEADLAVRFPHAVLAEADDAFGALLAEVIAIVEAPAADPARLAAIPLDVRGTAFQEAVWQALRTIPPGETLSYAALAAAAGRPGAVRAVGGANGANPVAVLIPCHRVVRSDGSIGGYAYGGGIKADLLAREGVVAVGVPTETAAERRRAGRKV